ncbi:MAG TPA: NfeD family protein [Nevskiaceae bacterium]|nr:NfeD family protein [Nevskiaceae bacterium]
MDWLVYWHWWVAGLVLLILEMIVPTGYILLWTGISAIVVGLIALFVPMPWTLEVVVFGALSFVSFFAFRKLFPQRKAPDERPTLNRRGHSYVGRTFTLTRPVVNGVGTLHVDDSQWRITGPDMPEGSQVRVIEADGATLKVERAA